MVANGERQALATFQLVAHSNMWRQVETSADVLLRGKGMSDVARQERCKEMRSGDVPVECSVYGNHQVFALGDTCT